MPSTEFIQSVVQQHGEAVLVLGSREAERRDVGDLPLRAIPDSWQDNASETDDSPEPTR